MSIGKSWKQILLVAVFLFLLILLSSYNFKFNVRNGSANESNEVEGYSNAATNAGNIGQSEENVSDNVNAAEVAYTSPSQSTECFPRDRLKPDELLPKGANLKWAEGHPTGQGELSDKNFLTAGFQFGTDSVGGTLRNANRQLRSEIPNPQVDKWPILQSTIEPDLSRRPLE
jgi:hypothetical protein